MTLEYVLDLPGNVDDEKTDLGVFSNELERLISLKSGHRAYISQGLTIQGQTWEYLSRSSGRLVSHSTFDNLKILLEKYNLAFENKVEDCKLCCEETTNKSRKLRFYNYIEEPIICADSDVPIYMIGFVSYIPGLNSDEDILERALIEEDIKLSEKYSDEGPPSSYLIFDSVADAQESIGKAILEDLKSELETEIQFVNKNLKVAFVEGNSKYKYPIDFPDAEITEENSLVLPITIPQIDRVYPDGKALLCGGEFPPLFQYFDKKEGFYSGRRTVCPRCYGKRSDSYERIFLKQGLKSEAVLNLSQDKLCGFFGDVAKSINYSFDPERIKIRLFGRKKVHVY